MRLLKNKAALLLAILLLAFSLHIYFESRAEFSQVSYASFAEARSIAESGFPTSTSPLSPPLFHYILAPIYRWSLAIKIFSALLFVSVAYLVNRLSFALTKDENASLLATLLAAFSPVFFSETLFLVTPNSLFLPLLLLFILAFVRIAERKYLYVAVALSFLLPLTSAAAAIVVPALIIYFAISKLLGITLSRKENEASFLVLFAILWVLFLLFKGSFEVHGFLAIFQNTPERIFASYFSGITINEVIAKIGFIPLALGVSAIYSRIFRPQEKESYLIVSFVFIIFLLLWQRLLELGFALLILSILLAVLSSYSIRDAMKYLSKTKIHHARADAYIAFLFIFMISMLIPSLSFASKEVSLSKDTDILLASHWIAEVSAEDAKVVSSPKSGHLIDYVSGRKPILTESYLRYNDANLIYNDIHKIYTTPFVTDALQLLNKHSVKYIILDSTAKREFSIEGLRYAEDKCFSETSFGTVKVYEVKCVLK